MARVGVITNAVNTGIAVQDDWENQEFIYHVSLNVHQLFIFLIHFELKEKLYKRKWTLIKPLPATDLVSSSNDGSKVRVAYQGLPGAYSEAAALKAYQKCETVPCDQFESVFKAVELWLVDKAVLPIENSVGGSIHRNYDLLFRHRLHIVGEVQMIVNHCLFGVPGVRKEELKRILSHPPVYIIIRVDKMDESHGLNVGRNCKGDLWR